MPGHTDISPDELERSLAATLQNLAGTAVSQPCHHVQHTLALLADLTGALSGNPTDEAVWQDARFARPAWQKPLRRRLVGAWSAWLAGTEGWLDGLDVSPHDKARLKLAFRQLQDALAPSNSPFNPALAERLKQTGGRCLREGVRNLLDDIVAQRVLPAVDNPNSLLVGRDLATTAGQVIYRTPQLELIQYLPLTSAIHAVPLLVIPPPLNRYYLLDLQPDSSLTRYALAQGMQVFMISWRNPNPSNATWGLTQYVRAAAAALDVACAISGNQQANLLGVCTGGVIGLALQGWLDGQNLSSRISAASYLSTPLHGRQHSELSLLASPTLRQRLRNLAWRNGCLDHRHLTAGFAWLRPGQLVWPHFQRYVLAQSAVPDPLTFWSQDSTRLPAQLVHDLLDVLERDALSAPNTLIIDGISIELDKLRTPSWHLGAERDHIVPWHNAYPGGCLGGDKTFTLSHGGHIQSLVNPPGHASAWYRSATARTDMTIAQWHAASERQPGSWWPEWHAWLRRYSGDLRSAPAVLGNAAYPAQYPAPGRYVHQL
ncbi:alpha/beta fold hydrolase [Pseudomonas sp. gcc21]|uniref:PHA/PHB synthase family protein n=1 Tax=Pseudomonas sp. gcc21 TaxID=2726989 RepID=UPI001451AE3D|nr:alpha/beta fold hydrolase [Pseudomonas sp. gcc21]QJD60087.1 alpha/beta fold hydrolase [Pseudomonas sp. gcc21]